MTNGYRKFGYTASQLGGAAKEHDNVATIIILHHVVMM
jgi:hypothetical protein